MKHDGPYDRFYESFTEAYAHMEEQGYKVADHPRTCYIDGIWNQENPEKWLSIIQIPIEQRVKMRAGNNHRNKAIVFITSTKATCYVYGL